MSQNLGRLTKIDLRDIWNNEATDFTPWLSQPDNLVVLGETLGIDLALEGKEMSVGPFSADILCRDIGTDTWVLIENQLERTDHKHLGQLLTYASGLQAVTIVWVAAKFTEEHRSTLDWLNKITDQSFRFFGLEIELWRIGDSLAAPKFNMVSKPNDWSRSMANATKSKDGLDLSGTKAMQLSYWDAFHVALNGAGGAVSGNRKPQPQSWMKYSIGRSNFDIGVAMLRPKSQIRTDVYMNGEHANSAFNLLHEKREEIEAEFGEPLDWDELENRVDCRVGIMMSDVNPDDEDDWGRQHAWLAEKVNKLHSVFSPRVQNFNPVDL